MHMRMSCNAHPVMTRMYPHLYHLRGTCLASRCDCHGSDLSDARNGIAAANTLDLSLQSTLMTAAEVVTSVDSFMPPCVHRRVIPEVRLRFTECQREPKVFDSSLPQVLILEPYGKHHHDHIASVASDYDYRRSIVTRRGHVWKCSEHVSAHERRKCAHMKTASQNHALHHASADAVHDAVAMGDDKITDDEKRELSQKLPRTHAPTPHDIPFPGNDKSPHLPPVCAPPVATCTCFDDQDTPCPASCDECGHHLELVFCHKVSVVLRVSLTPAHLSLFIYQRP